MTSEQTSKVAGGRPPKFKEACRPITVTLPDRILKSLERVSLDRARALVKCVEAAIGTGNSEKAPLELIEVLPGKALIVVNSNRLLSQIEWLRLVEIAPARFLLMLPSGIPIERLEVELRDLAESVNPIEDAENLLLETLQKTLTKHSRQRVIFKGELLLVDMPE